MITQAIIGTVTYTYDADGRKATVQYPSGKKFKYDYSGRGQLSHIYDQTLVGSPFQVLYYHDDSGNRTARDINGKTSFSDPNFTTYHYDANNRNISTQHYWATANIMWSHVYNYGYDKMGNRQYEMRDWQSQGDGFQYDLANQITGYQREGTVNTSTGEVTAPANDDTLNLDANGNRKSVIDNGATISYGTANNLNQYPSVAGLAATYDGNGNLATYNGWTYTYNAMNQLTRANASGTDAYFWYDGLGRICTWQSTGGPGVRFNVWSGWDLVEEYAYPDDSLLATYLHGESVDEMVSMTSDGTTKYLYQDGRGNTSAVAAANGMVLETYKYDLNGTPTVYDPAGNVISAGSTVDNRFLFGGREWYQTLGLYNFRNRFYLPNIGRFLQPDPIGFAGDPANLYRYCANNPVNFIDPTGEILEPGESVRGYWDDANRYLSGSPTYRGIYQQLNDSSTTYRIEFTNDHVSYFDGNTNTIYWNPTRAINTGLGGSQTPALVLAHELGHAYQQDIDPVAFIYWDTIASDSWDYGTYLEFHDITAIETPIAEELGEATRTDHNNHGDFAVWLPSDGGSPNHIAPKLNAFPGFASANGFTGSVTGYGPNGPTAGSITGSLLGDLQANAPSNQPKPKRKKKG